MPVQTSVTLAVDAPLPAVFDAARSINACELIRKRGPLPGVVAVDGHDAPWSAAGQTRHIVLSDNSSVDEELVAFTQNSTFAYNSSNFTGLFAPLVRGARGEWHFTQLRSDRTKIDWTYFFFPKGPVAEPILWFIVKMFWPGYLRSALLRVKAKAERSAHENRDL